jgi:hypothetical protein
MKRKQKTKQFLIFVLLIICFHDCMQEFWSYAWEGLAWGWTVWFMI